MRPLPSRESISYTPAAADAAHRAPGVRETGPVGPPPRLLDRVRAAIRARHYSRRTEKAYVAWIRRYIFFHDKRHPADMGAPEVTRFLSSLAVEGKVAASTQNQALSALLFLYREVLEVDLPWMDEIVRAKRPQRLPVVLTRDEVRAVLRRLEGTPRLMAFLLYGAGLRLFECCCLRVQDVDFGTNQIVVRSGKGDKDRVTMLPAVVKRISPDTCNASASSIAAISRPAPAEWSYRPHSPASTRTPAGSGCGSGSSRRPERTPTGSRVSIAAITCTSRSWSAP